MRKTFREFIEIKEAMQPQMQNGGTDEVDDEILKKPSLIMQTGPNAAKVNPLLAAALQKSRQTKASIAASVRAGQITQGMNNQPGKK